MLVSVELKNFRQHKNLTVKFTNGLQLLRGANEAGKSSVIEAVLYALYGTKSLRGTLGDTATWGCKESELKAKLVVNLDRTLYTFTRSKGGAAVSYTHLHPAAQPTKWRGARKPDPGAAKSGRRAAFPSPAAAEP